MQWILGSGAAWRDLPKEYGNRNSIYHKFRNWIDTDVFEKIFQELVKNHLFVNFINTPPVFGKFWEIKILGFHAEAKTTKIHALVNEYFQLIGVDLTGGEIHDSKVAIKLLSKVVLAGKKVLGDKAFSSKEIRGVRKNFCKKASDKILQR